MADWLIDQTDLYGIKHSLLREARVGSTVLGFIGLDPATNAKVSLVPGGLVDFIPPNVKNEAPTSGLMTRRFEVLIVAPITVEICRKTVGLQLGSWFYKKASEVPYDGVSTPAQWIFNVAYIGERDAITL